MKNAVKIDLVNNIITLNDGTKKTIDNYILELEDRLIKVYDILKDFGDVNPSHFYTITGESLFEVMDLLEDRK